MHLLLEESLERVHRHGLGALDGHAEVSVGDELGQRTDGTRDTEDDRVVGELGEAVLVQHAARGGVDVREGVLGLAVLLEHAGRHLRHLLHQLHDRRVAQLGARVAELAQRGEARVGLAQHGVAVTGHDTARLERRPEVLLDLLVRGVLADGLLHGKRPAEHLLVGKAVERASETEQGGRVGEVGVRERRADQVGGVRRDVAALVVSVESVVQTDDLDEACLVAEADLVLCASTPSRESERTA